MGVEFGKNDDVVEGWKGYDGRKLPPPSPKEPISPPKVVSVDKSQEIVEAWRPLSGSDTDEVTTETSGDNVEDEQGTDKMGTKQGGDETWWDIERG